MREGNTRRLCTASLRPHATAQGVTLTLTLTLTLTRTLALVRPLKVTITNYS